MGGLRRVLHFGSLYGRASRVEYLSVFLITLGVSAAQLVLDPIWPVLHTNLPMVLTIAAIYWLALVSVTVRRMHDIGKSGWLLPLWIIPIVGVVLLVWCVARPGVVGDNRFGSALLLPLRVGSGRLAGPTR